MKKFLLLYTAPVSAEEQMKSADPSKAAEAMKVWVDWFAKLGSALLDKGNPTGMAKTVTKEGTRPAEAPYVGGYSIVQAESVEAVEEMLADHPHFMLPGGRASILVSEIMEMPTA